MIGFEPIGPNGDKMDALTLSRQTNVDDKSFASSRQIFRRNRHKIL